MKPIFKMVRNMGGGLAEKMLSILPTHNTILFESSPDFACNTYPVFLQLRKELPNYKMVWGVAEETGIPEGVDDIFLFGSSGVLAKLKELYYMHTARAIVSCNREVNKRRKDQVHIFLCHGSKTKKTRGSYEPGSGVDYINVQSHFFDDIITYEYNCEKEKLVYLGYPRCDSFFNADLEIVRNNLNIGKSIRYLVWLPTYRKQKNPDVTTEIEHSSYSQMGMPLVYNYNALDRLDSFLRDRDMLIFFKPHPAQDISSLTSANTSNIRIIHDSDLQEMNVPLYDLLAGSDGLITDYSSVFFDYLLADKPIITTIDDMEEWKKMTGFAFDLDAFLDEATTRIATLDELLVFFDKIRSGTDGKEEGRKRIRELTNTYFDGDSAKRVAAFIREKIGE